MYKRLYFIGIIAYVWMTVLSVVFYKERIIFIDTAYALFNIVKDNSFWIGIYRFGDVFSELLPLFARRIGLSLNAIVMSYSLGFALFYFSCYVICGSIFKQYSLALVILLVNILFVADTFYWVASQLPQGIAMYIVILAYISSRQPGPSRWLAWLMLILALITVAFYHPLLVFTMAYTALFFALQSSIFPDKRQLYAVAAIFFFAIFLKALLFRTPYERHSMSGLKNFVTLFPNYFTLYSDKQFVYNCFTKFYWIPILSIVIILVYGKRKEWKKLILFSAAIFGYLFLIIVSFPSTDTQPFYIENLYLPVSLFIALPFIFDVLPVLEKKQMASLVISLIIITCGVRLYTTSNRYTARLDFERRILGQYGDTKIVLDAGKVHAGILQMVWGTPFEFLLLSETELHKPASIIIDEHPEKLAGLTTLKDGLRVNWETYPYNSLPARYFKFTDTLSGYIINP
jgi:hypothetical protein